MSAAIESAILASETVTTNQPLDLDPEPAVLTTSVVLIIFAAAMGSGTMVAIIAWFLSRMRSLESRGSSDSELKRLSHEVDDLRGELLANHSEIENLAERLDFTERLLSTGADGDGDESR